MKELSFLKRRDRDPALPVPVDFDAIEQQLMPNFPQAPAEFAPKRQQEADIDRAVRAITAFSALPTKEIDDTIFQLEEELADIKADAQRVRNAYVEVTDRLMKYIERQKAVNKIAVTAFAAMREQCAALDQPELPLEPAEPPEDPPKAAE
jgi:hypothetical protein